ncbi:hypothetical protein HNP92_000634 [Methanococcus maripaludis]|uniref:S-layer protein outer domain-containing protein n=1 Tax=Methanococcus maripaludis TaxID=39152 RepID=A0A7J9S4A7_METMI|nr:S-layer protein [Methanococcus maripaludis]MBB6401349.1 hypothetical protein [Methanococcus maripaludis]
MSAPSKLIALFILTVLCTLPISYGMVVDDPLIVVNSEKVDKTYAELLMDNYYSKRTLVVNSDNEIVVNEHIIYNVPAIDEFEINDNRGLLHIKFDKEGQNVVYKDVNYEEELESDDEGDMVSFMGKTYALMDYETDEKIKLGNWIEDLSTTGEFEYDGIKLNVLAKNGDSELIIEVYNGGERIDTIKLYRGDYAEIKNSKYSLYYDDYLESGDTPYFFFKMYESYDLEDGEYFKNTDNLKIKLDGKKILLDFKNPESLPRTFEMLNYVISVSSFDESNVMVCFSVQRSNSYELDMDEGTKYFGNNIFAVKIENDEDEDYDDELYLYKNNKKYDKIVDYQGSVQLVDQDELLSASSDLILIGGPVSNKVTESIQNSLSVEVTNDYPGEGKGVIQTITNPNNAESTILVLAGSDRDGTKACVLALNQGLYSGSGNLVVKLTGEDSVSAI